MCPSYPPQLLVPACISDETLEFVAKFRSSRRIPAIVWRYMISSFLCVTYNRVSHFFVFYQNDCVFLRHVNNGAVIARSSQPEVGWLGWRSSEDEDLLKALADACSYDKGESTMVDSPITYSDVGDDTITPSAAKVRILTLKGYSGVKPVQHIL